MEINDLRRNCSVVDKYLKEYDNLTSSIDEVEDNLSTIIEGYFKEMFPDGSQVDKAKIEVLQGRIYETFQKIEGNINDLTDAVENVLDEFAWHYREWESRGDEIENLGYHVNELVDQIQEKDDEISNLQRQVEDLKKDFVTAGKVLIM